MAYGVWDRNRPNKILLIFFLFSLCVFSRHYTQAPDHCFYICCYLILYSLVFSAPFTLYPIFHRFPIVGPLLLNCSLIAFLCSVTRGDGPHEPNNGSRYSPPLVLLIRLLSYCLTIVPPLFPIAYSSLFYVPLLEGTVHTNQITVLGTVPRSLLLIRLLDYRSPIVLRSLIYRFPIASQLLLNCSLIAFLLFRYSRGQSTRTK